MKRVLTTLLMMGLPMAGHLLKAGHDVAVWARRPEATADVAAAGAAVCASPAELAARSEVVISIITASAGTDLSTISTLAT